MIQQIDEKIIELCSNNQTLNKGYELLMSTYGKQLYWHIRRLVIDYHHSEDVLQETLVNVFKYINNFKHESKLSTWLYTIATNECLRFFKKNKIKISEFNTNNEYLLSKFSSETHLNSNELLAQFHKAILKLPDKQRIVFNLRYFDELSYEEISSITGSTVSALKTNYHYAFEKVKKTMCDE